MFRPYIVILGVYCQVTISSWHSPQEEEEEEKEEGRKKKEVKSSSDRCGAMCCNAWSNNNNINNKIPPHVHTKESTWTVQRATSTCTHKREHVDCTTSYIRMYTRKRASGLYNEQSSLYEYSPDMLLQTVLCFTHTTTMNSQSASATLTFFDEAGARGPVRAPLTVVPSLIVPGGILPMEISDSFP